MFTHICMDDSQVVTMSKKRKPWGERPVFDAIYLKLKKYKAIFVGKKTHKVLQNNRKFWMMVSSGVGEENGRKGDREAFTEASGALFLGWC